MVLWCGVWWCCRSHEAPFVVKVEDGEEPVILTDLRDAADVKQVCRRGARGCAVLTVRWLPVCGHQRRT